MGLLDFVLSKFNKGNRELNRINRNRRFAYYLCKCIQNYPHYLYLLGIIGLLLTPLRQMHQRGYYDENALLARDSGRSFSFADAAVTVEYKELFRPYISKNASERANFYMQQFQKLGLDSEVQEFSFVRQGSVQKGFNVYSVLRAPRSDGTEAILLSAPFSCMDAALNLHGTSILVSMARYFSKFSHWSKDFVFLLSDKSPVGTQAWLQAYHGEVQTSYLHYNELQYHAGEIRESINLDFAGDTDYTHIGIYTEGLNGQQSNADVVYTVMNLSQVVGIPVVIHDDDIPKKPNTRDPLELYLASLRGLMYYGRYQSLGFPVSDHSLLVRYRIEGVTIRGLHDGRRHPGVGLHHISYVLESSSRAFSNLLERFHHSFWFYLLLQRDWFLLISFYIGPVALVSFPLLLLGLKNWWLSNSSDALLYPDASKSDYKKKVLHQLGEEAGRPSSAFYRMQDGRQVFSRNTRSFSSALVSLVLCHVAGALIFYAPMSGISFVWSSIAFSMAVAMYIVPTIVGRLKDSAKDSSKDQYLLKSIVCTEAALGLLSIAILNPSLSVALAIPTTPILVALKRESQFKSAQALYLICCLPPVLFSIAFMIGQLVTEGSLDYESIALYISWLFDTGSFSFTVYGAWFYPFICFFYWPVILCSISFLFC